jgi:hypothetical protein
MYGAHIKTIKLCFGEGTKLHYFFDHAWASSRILRRKQSNK